VDEDQVFVLLLNGPAQAESIDAHVRCEAEGIHEQFRAQRLQGAERSRMLRQLKDQLYDLGENWEGRDASQDKRLEVLRCQRTLPANAKVSLVWGAGIATASGQSNPSEQRFEYTVRDHFRGPHALPARERQGRLPAADADSARLHSTSRA
jgi:uncharacterized protein (DUF2235 family)